MNKLADLLRREVFGQAGRGEGCLPAAMGRLEFVAGVGGSFFGRLGFLPRSRPFGVERHERFELSQIGLGGLEAGREVAATLGQLLVERVAFLLGLLRLSPKHRELLATRFELPGRRFFQEPFCCRRRPEGQNAEHGERPAKRTDNFRRQEQPGQQQQHAEHEDAAQAGQYPPGQDLPLK